MTFCHGWPPRPLAGWPGAVTTEYRDSGQDKCGEMAEGAQWLLQRCSRRYTGNSRRQSHVCVRYHLPARLLDRRNLAQSGIRASKIFEPVDVEV